MNSIEINAEEFIIGYAEYLLWLEDLPATEIDNAVRQVRPSCERYLARLAADPRLVTWPATGGMSEVPDWRGDTGETPDWRAAGAQFAVTRNAGDHPWASAPDGSVRDEIARSVGPQVLKSLSERGGVYQTGLGFGGPEGHTN